MTGKKHHQTGVTVKQHLTGHPGFHWFPWQHHLAGLMEERGGLVIILLHDEVGIS